MTSDGHDALALLQRHHRHLEALFDEVFEAEDAEQRGWAVQKACDELASVMAAEEQLLYKRMPADDPLRLQAEQEHRALTLLAGELLALAPIEPEVEECCRTLFEAVLAHHRFEHEQVFPHAARQLPAAQRTSLATAMAALLVQLHAAGAPRRALLRRPLPQPAGAEMSRTV